VATPIRIGGKDRALLKILLGPGTNSLGEIGRAIGRFIEIYYHDAYVSRCAKGTVCPEH
jgi:hypothetical protein